MDHDIPEVSAADAFRSWKFQDDESENTVEMDDSQEVTAAQAARRWKFEGSTATELSSEMDRDDLVVELDVADSGPSPRKHHESQNSDFHPDGVVIALTDTTRNSPEVSAVDAFRGSSSVIQQGDAPHMIPVDVAMDFQIPGDIASQRIMFLQAGAEAEPNSMNPSFHVRSSPRATNHFHTLDATDRDVLDPSAADAFRSWKFLDDEDGNSTSESAEAPVISAAQALMRWKFQDDSSASPSDSVIDIEDDSPDHSGPDAIRRRIADQETTNPVGVLEIEHSPVILAVDVVGNWPFDDDSSSEHISANEVDADRADVSAADALRGWNLNDEDSESDASGKEQATDCTPEITVAVPAHPPPALTAVRDVGDEVEIDPEGMNISAADALRRWSFQDTDSVGDDDVDIPPPDAGDRQCTPDFLTAADCTPAIARNNMSTGIHDQVSSGAVGSLIPTWSVLEHVVPPTNAVLDALIPCGDRPAVPDPGCDPDPGCNPEMSHALPQLALQNSLDTSTAGVRARDHSLHHVDHVQGLSAPEIETEAASDHSRGDMQGMAVSSTLHVLVDNMLEHRQTAPNVSITYLSGRPCASVKNTVNATHPQPLTPEGSRLENVSISPSRITVPTVFTDSFFDFVDESYLDVGQYDNFTIEEEGEMEDNFTDLDGSSAYDENCREGELLE